MCLLTFFPPFAEVNTERLECGARCNPHGHGFAIVTADGQVIVDHAMRPDELIERFAKLREQYPDSHALFHSRITTHGSTNLANCHPFQVIGPRGGQTILAHNGILPTDCQPKGKDSRSDTRILAEDMLWKRWGKYRLAPLGSRKPRFTKRWLDSPEVRKSIEKWLGTGSKVLVLTTNPRLAKTAYLFNERLGDWVDGVWYSNSSYETWKPSSYRDGYYGGTSYVYRGGEFVPTRETQSQWWDDWPTVVGSKPESQMSLWVGSTNMENGTVWSGRAWYPKQSYLWHFNRRTCDVCNSVRINRNDYICDVCGVCWICNEYFTDCWSEEVVTEDGKVIPAGDGCAWDIAIRGPFDENAGIKPGDSAKHLEQIISDLRKAGTLRDIVPAIKSAAASAQVFMNEMEGVNVQSE